jgi:integrase
LSVKRLPPRKDGSIPWGVRWREGGKNRQKVFDSRKDARDFEAEVHRRRRLRGTGLLIDTRRTVAELHVEWRATHGAGLGRKTLLQCDGTWRSLVEPHFGALQLSDVTALAVEKWARARLDEGRGEASVEKGWLLLSSMFRSAEAWEWTEKNPVRAARRPRKRNRTRVPIALSPVQVEALRTAMGRDVDKYLVSVLAYAGLRPGEALALAWGDIGRTHIEVTKALSLGQVNGTKTRRDRRVPVIGPLRRDLIGWGFRVGPHGVEDLVFPNSEGRHWSEAGYRQWAHRYFKPALVAAGLPGTLRPYDLRHTHASLLIRSGLDVVQVARRLGHSPGMCLSTYAHVIEGLEGTEPFDLEAEIVRAKAAVDDRAETA